MTPSATAQGRRSDGLPEGWRWARLGDVCQPDRQVIEPGTAQAQSLPYLSLEHIESNTGRVLRAPATPTEDEGKSTTFAFDDRHVLYGKLRPYLNKVALPGFRGRCTTEIIPLLPREIDRAFLAWALRRSETVEAAMRAKTGSRMPRADMADLLSLEIPVPSIPEQHRIAALLNEQMAAVERARAAAEAQLDAAKALPAAYLRAVFESDDARGWPVRKLGDVGEIGAGITLGRKLDGLKTRRVPYLRVANVKDGRLDLSDVYDTPATEAEIARCALRYGDLLLTEGGDPDKLGRGSFWEQQLSECIHQNHIFRVRFDLAEFSPAFLSAQIGSPYGKGYFLAHAKQTTGIATINQRVLSAFPVMAPTRKEQLRTVARLSEQAAEAARLSAAAEAQLDALRRLPAALVRRAFSGEV
jgi:type I restriction enzyme S subunit